MDKYLGTFALFINHGKTGKQPDYTGKMEFEGKKLEVAAWKRTSQAGNDFLSGTIQEVRVKEDTEQAFKPTKEVEDIPDEPIDLSEIPF